ncbi:MAG TPA: ABC transporter permease [Microbacteriaceae bacterium]|nr:ABC transporter permease [Microbacteriaceae bacterium]HQX35072.1 ABC transporter permease [Microbacteriaceae bacterium]HQZ46986.1 ABC transporter permease [Microbacteriaceae bacterium]HRA08125.1 ABC transporter permease [Microbacteriaceae bacterium]
MHDTRRRGMLRRALVRAAELAGSIVLVLWGAATLAFLTMRLVPGDAVDIMLGPQAQVAPEVKDAIRVELGLDLPWYEQYWSFLARMLRGDFGESYQLRLPVTEVIGRQLAPTLQLTGLALLIALVIAFGVALLARGRRSRGIVATLELVVLSSPVFWIGLILLTVFSFTLGWFPVAGSRGFGALVLPAVTLALPCAALLGQVLRDGLEDAERQPFALSVRARGASDTRLLLRHTLRHGSTGALTLSGYLVGSLLGGTVLVETVFARAGIGRVTLSAITDRDLPVVIAVIMLSAVVFVVVHLLVDLAYPLLDPRLRDRAGAR